MEFLLLLIVTPGVLVCSFISCVFCKLIGLDVDEVWVWKMRRRMDDPS